MNSFVLHKFSETGFPFNRNFAANLVGSTESVSNLVGSTESVSNVEWMDVGRLAAT